MTLDSIISLLVYVGLGFLLVIVGKYVYSLFHPRININNELVERDNSAFALSYLGYFVGIVLGIGGAIFGPSHGAVEDIMDIVIYGLLAILLMNISLWLNDKLILFQFSVQDEIIRDKNPGVGVVEAASSIATGMIIFAAISGEGGGLHTALAFWGIGQFIFVLATWLYNRITPYDLHEHLEKDNIAVGIAYAGAILSVGNILRFAISGDFISWFDNLSVLGSDMIIALIALPLVRIFADKVLLPGRKLSDELVNQKHANIGAGLLEASAYVSASLLIIWSL